jgi:hypothetical protein
MKNNPNSLSVEGSVEGTDGDDTIIGTNEDDRIYCGDGNDENLDERGDNRINSGGRPPNETSVIIYDYRSSLPLFKALATLNPHIAN